MRLEKLQPRDQAQECRAGREPVESAQLQEQDRDRRRCDAEPYRPVGRGVAARGEKQADGDARRHDPRQPPRERCNMRREGEAEARAHGAQLSIRDLARGWRRPAWRLQALHVAPGRAYSASARRHLIRCVGPRPGATSTPGSLKP